MPGTVNHIELRIAAQCQGLLAGIHRHQRIALAHDHLDDTKYEHAKRPTGNNPVGLFV